MGGLMKSIVNKCVYPNSIGVQIQKAEYKGVYRNKQRYYLTSHA